MDPNIMLFKVYYLDDELDLLETFHDTFESDTLKISTFSDPTLFMEALKRERPDLVFLDFRLPGTTGDIIAHQMDPSIPKALITGDLNVKITANFNAVFEKPVRAHEVQKFIDSFAKARGKP